MKKASGPARTSVRWRKEVEQARERLHRGFLAALAHAGLFLFGATITALRSPLPGSTWAIVLGAGAGLSLLGWLTRRGFVAAPLLLLVAALGPFLHSLIFRPGLSLNLAAIIFAWFYLEGLRGALALRRRLNAPAME